MINIRLRNNQQNQRQRENEVMNKVTIKKTEDTRDIFPGETLHFYEINDKHIVFAEDLDKIVARLPKSTIEEIVLALLAASERTYFTFEDLIKDLSARNSLYYQPRYWTIEECMNDLYEDQADDLKN